MVFPPNTPSRDKPHINIPKALVWPNHKPSSGIQPHSNITKGEQRTGQPAISFLRFFINASILLLLTHNTTSSFKPHINIPKGLVLPIHTPSRGIQPHINMRTIMVMPIHKHNKDKLDTD